MSALRRPSQTLGLSSHSVHHHRNLLYELAQKFKTHEEDHATSEKARMKYDYNKRLGE